MWPSAPYYMPSLSVFCVQLMHSSWQLCGAIIDQSYFAARFASSLAIHLREARVQIASGGVGRAAPSLAALSASLLPGIFRCPGTQRTRIAPGKVWGRRARNGHQRASSWKSVKTCQEELVKGERSRNATFKLFKKTYIFIANLAAGEVSAARALLSAASASALNTFI